MLHQRVEAMWWDKYSKPFLLLRGLSVVYNLLMKYDQRSRLKQAVKSEVALISVGNITVGGSGKTPFVVWLATELKRKGFNPVLLSRGDGANNQVPHLVSVYSKACEVGDEAILLHKLSGCPVVAGRDRVTGAKLASKYGDVIILDDGFQYRQLDRDCDIVLVPSEGVGNGCLLPAGPLRESVAALARADMVVRSGQGAAKSLSKQKEWFWSVKSGEVRDWNSDEDVFLESSGSIDVVTGIARPERVLNDLRDVGFEIGEHYYFEDHHDYTVSEVKKVLQGSNHVVTTAKDAVKLHAIWPSYKPLWVLEQRQVSVEEGLVEMVVSTLESKRT